jgi:Zn finger protein HypA/HybF involved in hydrogenase expression
VPAVRCPDCGTLVELGSHVRTGDLVECPNCAGHALRIRRKGDRWAASLAHRVSCPDCDEVITLPEDAGAGDTVGCCGRTYRLSFAYGAFAADKDAGEPHVA